MTSGSCEPRNATLMHIGYPPYPDSEAATTREDLFGGAGIIRTITLVHRLKPLLERSR